MSRYESVGAFQVESSFSHSVDGELVEVIVEIADCRDKQNGHVYRDGCWRVSIRSASKKALDFLAPLKLTTKRKYGESAWSWAERIAGDYGQAIRMAETKRYHRL